jgi:hypothetical protein
MHGEKSFKACTGNADRRQAPAVLAGNYVVATKHWPYGQLRTAPTLRTCGRHLRYKQRHWQLRIGNYCMGTYQWAATHGTDKGRTGGRHLGRLQHADLARDGEDGGDLDGVEGPDHDGRRRRRRQEACAYKTRII